MIRNQITTKQYLVREHNGDELDEGGRYADNIEFFATLKKAREYIAKKSEYKFHQILRCFVTTWEERATDQDEWRDDFDYEVGASVDR